MPRAVIIQPWRCSRVDPAGSVEADFMRRTGGKRRSPRFGRTGARADPPCHALPYTGKDAARIGAVDDLLVGRANVIHERGEHDLNTGR
jgi:hypothetical protein